MASRAPALLGLLLLTAAASPRSVPAERTVTLSNHADRPINEVYASPSSLDDWGPDRLGEATIEPRESRRIVLGPAASGECLYDLQIVYGDASREEFRGMDLCRTRTLTLDATHAVPPEGAEGGGHSVLIENDSALPIQQVLISPAEAGEWGDDRLGHDSLSVGETAVVAYRGGCLADLRVVFENRSAEERRGLDLCAQGGVTIRPGWTTSVPSPSPRPSQAERLTTATAVSVVNRAGRPIRELYIFPEASAASGPERLGGSALDDGRETVVSVIRPPGTCRYAARVVYGGKTPNQDLSGLDLCREPALVVTPRT